MFVSSMIQRFSTSSFMALRAAEIQLAPLTVLIGPNAAGKSSVLQALSLLCSLATQRWSPLLEDLDQLRTLGRADTVRLDLSGRWTIPGGEVSGHAKLEAQREQTRGRSGWRLLMEGSWGDQVFRAPDYQDSHGRALGADLPGLGAALLSTPVLRMDKRALAAPSFTEPPHTIGEDGAGLASALAEMAATEPELFEQLQEILRGVIPGVRRLRLARIQRTVQDPEHGQYTSWGHELFFDMTQVTRLPARLVSEGTLLVLGLLTVLLRTRPRLVLLDDVDHGLHPLAQADLIRQLRTLQTERPGLQIVATTHSPILLEQLAPQEIRMLVSDDEGMALVGNMDEHPEYSQWKDLMGPGEFWSAVGERWLKQRTTPGRD